MASISLAVFDYAFVISRYLASVCSMDVFRYSFLVATNEAFSSKGLIMSVPPSLTGVQRHGSILLRASLMRYLFSLISSKEQSAGGLLS